VPPERLHATLLFLGDQSGQHLQMLRDIASTLNFPACQVSLDRCGYFPRAAVLWIGPSKVPPELQAFQAALSESVGGSGICFDERAWRFHITLYRNLRKPPERIEFEPVEWRPGGFQLLESVHDGNGLRYLCRGRWPA
jgi:2'-5' RNA ligase